MLPSGFLWKQKTGYIELGQTTLLMQPELPGFMMYLDKPVQVIVTCDLVKCAEIWLPIVKWDREDPISGTTA